MITHIDEQLIKRIDHADAIIKWSAFGSVVMIFIILVIIIFQLLAIQNSIQDSLVQSRKTAAENHKRTQEYVKCIAVTLLKPVAQRKPEDFDKCANGTIDPNTGAFIPNEDNSIAEQKTSSQMQVGSSPEAAAPPPLTEAPAPSQPTTSAPPNPEQTPRRTGIDRVQESLKELLNGVESTIGTIEKGI